MLLRGKPQADAYEHAGFKRNLGNASTLASKPVIAARIKHLKNLGAKQAVKKAKVNVQQVLEELSKIGFSEICSTI